MTTPDDPSERQRIGGALAKVASGIYIATARVDDEQIGMLCSFVEQCSFEPPMISIAVGKDRALLQALDGHGLFGLHVLSKENNGLMKAFSRPGDSFEGLEQAENLFEIPQLSDAYAFLACKVAGRIVAGDHILYTAEVFDGELQHPGQEPMVRIRTNGFKY